VDIWTMIADERRLAADFIEGLDADQLATPSLCGAWTVREVAGHLTVTFHHSLPSFFWRIVRSGGFDRANLKMGSELGARPPAEIATDLREHAEYRFTPPGLGPAAPLSDLLVHGQDMRRPLGLTRQFPPAAAEVSLDLLTSKKARRFNPKGGIAGLRFTATDQDWTAGDGPEVRGTGEALLVTLYGRPAPLDELEGDGVEEFRARFR
jgi:uncharacterized protein (TIGR03083 family)